MPNRSSSLPALSRRDLLKLSLAGALLPAVIRTSRADDPPINYLTADQLPANAQIS